MIGNVETAGWQSVWLLRALLGTEKRISRHRGVPTVHCWPAVSLLCHRRPDPSVTTKLQRSLNAKATKHTVEAAVETMKEQSGSEGKWRWVHHKAITAKGAWCWKVVRPEGPHMHLSDVEYAIAARRHLDLRPFPAHATATMPEHCPLCTNNRTGALVSLVDDPWHWLACPKLTGEELSRRHHAVVDAIGRVAWMVGAQVRKEGKVWTLAARKGLTCR